MGQQLQHTELEGHRQPCIVWLEKDNNGIDLVEAGEEVQSVPKVFFVLVNSSRVPNAWSVNEMEL